jgi:SNF2 family DNA or RNA helicase
MGTGKTLQALAIMACYQEEWPLLIVVPASLRLQWAEVVEDWIPFLRPADIHVVFGSTDKIFATSECPPVVITSYEMLRNLETSMTHIGFNCSI